MLGLPENNCNVLPVVHYWKLCNCMWIVFHVEMHFMFYFPLLTLSSSSILIHLNRCFPAKRQTGHMVVFSCFKWKKKWILHISYPPPVSDSSEHADDICLLLEGSIFPTSNHRNTMIEIGVFKFYPCFEGPVLHSFTRKKFL